MKRAFLFVFSDEIGTSLGIKDLVSSIPEITTWRYDMGHAMYLISELNADTLAKRIREKFPTGRFVVTEIEATQPEVTQGWLTPESWYLIEHKTPKPKTS